MGQKLILDADDDLLKVDDLDVRGITAGCYCCAQPINVDYRLLDTLPVAKVKDSMYHIFLCNSCEKDIEYLKMSGKNEVSYDILWIIQKDLELELSKTVWDKDLSEEKEEKEREKIVVKLYNDVDKKLKKSKTKDFIKKLAKKK